VTLALAFPAISLAAPPTHSGSLASRPGTRSAVRAKPKHKVGRISRSSTQAGPAVTEVAVRLGKVQAGSPVKGTLVLAASRPFTARSVGLAVRDAAGHRVDYPGAAASVRFGAGKYTYTSLSRTFPAGKYKVYGFWETTAGVYHALPAVTMTVLAAPAAAAPAVASAAAPANAAGSAAGSPSSPLPKGMPGPWTLKGADEFNGTALSADTWQAGWFGSGITGPASPSEQACYSPANVTFPGDGTVHLKLTSTPATCGGSTRPYTGALLSSNPTDGRASGGYQYTYGALEARVYVPASGTQVANWPAIWTDGQSWPTGGEDDVLEGLSGQACFHFHSAAGGPGSCASGNFTGWHTFGSDWEPGSVTYYYDGVEVGRITTGVTAAPMYLILTNTVSGSPGATTVAPADMQVDYVRVWQH
jgi:beta-glucanase (GH16 family)